MLQRYNDKITQQKRAQTTNCPTCTNDPLLTCTDEPWTTFVQLMFPLYAFELWKLPEMNNMRLCSHTLVIKMHLPNRPQGKESCTRWRSARMQATSKSNHQKPILPDNLAQSFPTLQCDIESTLFLALWMCWLWLMHGRSSLRLSLRCRTQSVVRGAVVSFFGRIGVPRQSGAGVWQRTCLSSWHVCWACLLPKQFEHLKVLRQCCNLARRMPKVELLWLSAVSRQPRWESNFLKNIPYELRQWFMVLGCWTDTTFFPFRHRSFHELEGQA